MRTFLSKLSALFLVLIVSLGVTIAFLVVRSVMRFSDEAEQKVNMGLAGELAVEFQPLLDRGIDPDSLQQRIDRVLGINPRIEIYLVAGDGSLKANFVGADKELVRTKVDLEPIRAWLTGADPPVLGTDPVSSNGRKPFSATQIEIMGQEAYLYVILGGSRFDSAASMIRDSYIVRATLKGLSIVLLVTGAVGILLFSLLTRRLRAMKEVVSAFEAGNHQTRVEVKSADEIGQLGQSFNQMADTIVSVLDDLKKTDRLRRELVANVSHDLRSPLSSIRGYLETIQIKDEELSPDERRRYIDIVLRNTVSLSNLVSALFELSKLDAEQVRPNNEPFSVAELVQDLVQQYRPDAENVGVRLEAELPPDLSLAYGDIALVERAVSNLIDNAIRFTPDGGVVRIVPRDSGDRIGLSIIDTGDGIPEDELPHIFDRFYRVEKSRTRGRGGAGLGLAIARKIVELHGAKLSVQSATGMGTTFSFELPVARV